MQSFFYTNGGEVKNYFLFVRLITDYKCKSSNHKDL